MAFSWEPLLMVVLLADSVAMLGVGGVSGVLAPDDSKLPLVVNTWTGDFSQATARAWDALSSEEAHSPAVLDAVEHGCNTCEDIQCGGSVGYGGRPDASDEVTLDSMVMYGPSHSVGAVGYLRRIKNAATVARAVMEHTAHTMLAGEGATLFAKMMGIEEDDLSTDDSHKAYQAWKEDSCQPNYYRFAGAGDTCPPYDPPSTPSAVAADSSIAALGKHDSQQAAAYADRGTWSRFDGRARFQRSRDPARLLISEDNHDTIGIIAVDERGDLACGTTTNGAANKIPGRVGDSPIAGAGCYVDNDIGSAAATGDGDVMMRFLPSFRAVESMRAGFSPQDACADALCRIVRFYPTFGGALVCANKAGVHGAARHGLSFAYSYQSPGYDSPQVAQAVKIDDEVCARFRKTPSQGAES
ncbi:unnamed protein product [Ectocarpus sp. 4 AP-2014]